MQLREVDCDKMDNLYDDFHDPSDDFKKEPRYFCYDLAESLVTDARSKGGTWYTHTDTIKGIMLLLFTWNFAAKKTKKLNFQNVRRTLQRCQKQLEALEAHTLESFDKRAEKRIEKVFREFMTLMGQTGASKALSLVNPKLFVMWDTKIRKRLKKALIRGIKNGEKPEHYVQFLKGVRKIIEQYGLRSKLPEDAILAKKFDEYNYVKIVMSRST